MDSNSGEIRMFPEEVAVPQGWTSWEKGEIVKIKDCYFKLMGINVPQQQIIFKGISKEEGIKHTPTS